MQYSYSVLKYQPSLDSDQVLNFGVAVESKATGEVYLLGLNFEAPSSASAIGKAVSKALPQLLARLIDTAIHNSQENRLSWVAENLGWNFHLSAPAEIPSEEAIAKLAHTLFYDHVMARVSPPIVGVEDHVYYATQTTFSMTSSPREALPA